jgi:hypothetical protein
LGQRCAHHRPETISGLNFELPSIPSSIRHCERSEAIHLAALRKNGLLRRFAPRNDAKRTFAFTRRKTPE